MSSTRPTGRPPRALRSATALAQRGAAALIVTMLLFFAMVLVAFFVNRNLVFEQRSAANQYRSTQAFEAAEAGLEWALAQLNNPRRIDAECRPLDAADADQPQASSFRTRYLRYTRVGGNYTPVAASNTSGAGALQASCVRGAVGWSCSCPSSGAPTLTTAPGAAFTLQFAPSGKPGIVQVSATGCTSLAGACLPGSSSTTDATAKVNVAFGLLPGLRTVPAATVTVRGAFQADAAALTVRNLDPASGFAIDAGGPIAAAQAQLVAPGGGAGTVVGDDAALAALTPERFFASYFGLDKAAWKNQPAVTRVRCNAASDCGAALASAIAATPELPLIWVDGDLSVSGPLALGSVTKPVLIVASGAARLSGAVTLNGLLYAAALQWDDTRNGAAFVRGALISESGYAGNGTPELNYDTAVLGALQGNAGSFARVNGSWRDF